jgi:hypothetical protein
MTSRQKAKDKRDRLLYNLLPGERERIRIHQGGRDPITGQPLKPNANLDHDHKSGLIRGLLNPMTNKLLVDNVSVLKATLKYLESPPAVAALGEPVYGLLGRATRKRKPRYGPDGRSEPVHRTVEV